MTHATPKHITDLQQTLSTTIAECQPVERQLRELGLPAGAEVFRKRILLDACRFEVAVADGDLMVFENHIESGEEPWDAMVAAIPPTEEERREAGVLF